MKVYKGKGSDPLIFISMTEEEARQYLTYNYCPMDSEDPEPCGICNQNELLNQLYTVVMS